MTFNTTKIAECHLFKLRALFLGMEIILSNFGEQYVVVLFVAISTTRPTQERNDQYKIGYIFRRADPLLMVPYDR